MSLRMKSRHIYVLLFGVPGFLVSLIIAFAAVGGATGLLWINVFGDNPWPSYSRAILFLLFLIVFMTLWAVCIGLGFLIGKNREGQGGVPAKHIVASGGVVIALIVAILLHQFIVGNIGPESDDVRCSEFCRGKGYAGSGIPPKDSGASYCSCFDSEGQEVMNVPMAGLASSGTE